MNKCKLGYRQAQNELYNLYSKAMYNICCRMMNDEIEAQDQLQESFLEAFRKIDSFKQDSTFGAWLKRIVVNKCINALKKKKVDLTYEEQVPDQLNEETDEIEIQLSINKVNKAINELPDGYRVIVSLYLLEGYDHREIATILNITESTSKTQFHRAKKKLKENLLSYE